MLIPVSGDKARRIKNMYTLGWHPYTNSFIERFVLLKGHLQEIQRLLPFFQC